MNKILRLLESALLIVLSTAILVTSIYTMRESLKDEHTKYDRGMLIFDPALFAKKDAQEIALEDLLEQQENIIYDLEDSQRIELNSFLTKFSEQNIDAASTLEHMSMAKFAARYHQIHEQGGEYIPYETIERIVSDYFGVTLWRDMLNGGTDSFSIGANEVYLKKSDEAHNFVSILTGFYVNKDDTFTCDFDIYRISDAMSVSEEYLRLTYAQAIKNTQLTYIASGRALLEQTDTVFHMLSYTSLREGYCGDDIQWEYDYASQTLRLSGSGDMIDYSDWYGMPPWHLYAKSIEKVIISDEITSIGSFSFFGCQMLQEIELPSVLTSVGISAFSGCISLKEINFPENLFTIGEYAFHGCLQLETLTFPQRLDKIELRAFNECDSLKSVTIPQNVSFLDQYVFAYCDQLTSIRVDPENPYYASDEYGVLFDKEMKTLYQFPCGSAIDYTVPDGVEMIDFYAFQNAKLTGLTLPDSVTEIERDAFSSCENLARVTFGSGVKTLGNELFYGCYNLERFEVHPDNPYFCSDENGMLWSRDMTVLVQCPKTMAGRVVLPDSVRTVAESAFISCRLITGVDLNNVDYIEQDAFADCTSLTEIEIPSVVNHIPMRCFFDCSNLKKVILPATMMMIDHLSFAGCDRLEGIYFMGNMPRFAYGIWIDYINPKLTLYYLEGAEGWNEDSFEGIPIRTWVEE